MKNRKGFTLIELLVVIAIIALLLAVILPSLRAAKELASGVMCLNKQKQLCLAWTSYYNDNKGLLVGGSNYYAGTRATPYRWVEYPMEADGSYATEDRYSITTRNNGIRAGKLYPYTQDEDIYHCPGDRNNTKPEPEAVFRSYSIAGLMNGEDFVDRVSGLYSPIKTYRVASDLNNKKLYVVTKFSEITAPGNKYVFVEEDVSMKNPKQNENAGGFVLLGGGKINWWDWPAYYHNDTSTLGFADGHAERHRWRDPDTLKLMKGEPINPPDDLPNNQDLRWMIGGYIPKP